MTEIISFTPHSDRKSSENLEAFVALCRDQLTVFGADLDWDASKWNGIVTFAKLGVITRKPKADQVMDKQFINFAKAYFRYQQGFKPTGPKDEGKALRATEAALLQVNGSADIRGLSVTVLDEAVMLAKEPYKSTHYACGRELERLAKFVTEKHLVPGNINGWRNPVKKPNSGTATGSKAKEEREKKLPDEIGLNAIAEIFANDPENDRDIFTTSVFAMLMSAPSRISEVLALPVDCEVFETDSKGVERYGWRFFAGKGGEGDIKWIPTEMVQVSKTAVSRAKGLSEEARNLAVWIEKKPDLFYRHQGCPNVPDDAPLTMEQACRALGLGHETRKDCRQSLNQRKLKVADDFHTLNSLWRHVVGRLPKSFPWLDEQKGVKFSNALFALNKDQFHGNRPRSPVQLLKPTNNFYNNDLSPRDSLNSGKHRSIFDRYGYKDSNGKQLKLSSHQPRHLLNTIAQRGGLSNLEIAKWSGRADVRQNRTYNHMTEYEFVSMAESLDPSKELFGPTDEVAKNIPVTTQEFNSLERAAAHVTEFGYCVHDYTMSPCEKFRDCINCTEQVCVKGDEEKLGRLKDRLERTEKLLAIAHEAIEDGEMGADRWYQYHTKTAKRLRELVEILDNPELEEGAQVKLRGNDFSHLRRVVEKKSAQSVGGSQEPAFLEEVSKMLGGGFG